MTDTVPIPDRLVIEAVDHIDLTAGFEVIADRVTAARFLRDWPRNNELTDGQRAEVLSRYEPPAEEGAELLQGGGAWLSGPCMGGPGR